MKWLSWSLVDARKEIGGAEIHALCTGQHLAADFGVDFQTSNRLEDLFDTSLDVIQTHGSALPKHFYRKFRAERKLPRRPLRIQTLHGESLESMRALNQWHRVGRWKAFFRELRACLASDLVVAVRGNLWLVRLLEWAGKKVVVSENGWDSSQASPLVHEVQNEEAFQTFLPMLENSGPFLLFVGRQQDPLKAFGRVQALLKSDARLRVVAVPGYGLAETPQLLPTGALSPRQLTELYARARALILTSVVEGMPLVLLEALAQGCPALVSDIKGHRFLAKRGLENYFIVGRPGRTESWKKSLKKLPASRADRGAAAERNRSGLRTWKQVAATVFAAARETLLARP